MSKKVPFASSSKRIAFSRCADIPKARAEFLSNFSGQPFDSVLPQKLLGRKEKLSCPGFIHGKEPAVLSSRDTPGRSSHSEGH